MFRRSMLRQSRGYRAVAPCFWESSVWRRELEVDITAISEFHATRGLQTDGPVCRPVARGWRQPPVSATRHLLLTPAVQSGNPQRRTES